jgi:tetratricopeptide (TPR) repeat protein
MIDRQNNSKQSRRAVALALLSIIIFLSYSNTFDSAWQFDDHPNIVLNPYLHISDLKPATLYDTFFASRKDGFYQQTRLYRPLACLSLALNWYVGQADVTGYHVVNLLIHLVTGYVLFLTVLYLLNSPKLRGKYDGSRYFVALMTATLWAVNPIQTQAVTYIVQRMASMAAMFYILGIYFYVKARLQPASWKTYAFFVACFLSYGCALATKENTATLPLAIILLEVIFFQDLSSARTRRRIIWAAVISGLGIVLLGILFFLQGDPLGFLKHYGERSFTPWQRLMTQPRILIFYLTLIFYPVPTRLSIEHDVMVSSSLIDPWTTLASIVLIFLLIGAGISQIRKRPIVGFAILFFFLTHLIESSIVGLELIFEHRNYLPSLFVFFPVAVAIKWLLDYYRVRKRSMYVIMVSFFSLIIMGFGMGTYVRNIAWFSEKTLWEDAMPKAPNSKRPHHNVAWGYYWKTGQYDKAAEMYAQTLGTKTHAGISQARAINNIGNIHFIKGELDEAIEMFAEAHRRYPQYALFQLNLAKVKIKTGDIQRALVLLDKILSKVPGHRQALSLKGQVLLKMKRYEEAVDCYRRFLEQKPNDPIAKLNAGIGLRLTGKIEQAKSYLQAASQRDPANIPISLWLIETDLTLEDRDSADAGLDSLLARHSLGALGSELKRLQVDNLMPPASRQMITQELTRKLESHSAELALADHR